MGKRDLNNIKHICIENQAIDSSISNCHIMNKQ